ncbi:DegT/DnrJ/EryC1/StrS family aminotransferase [Pirellulaceae bacterium SH449]
MAAGKLAGVPLLDVNRGNLLVHEEIMEAIEAVVLSGRFLHGPDVGELECSVAGVCQTKYAIGCASGSDALLLALMALEVQPGDEVIVPSFTFFATASAVARLGAIPVFADIDPHTYNIDPSQIEANISSRTRAIIPVHLFGQCAAMDKICAIAEAKKVPVIEDAAQAIGAAYLGKPAGAWGDMGCLSFYPTKNLGGMGDGGMMVCQDDELASKLRLYAAHGMQPRYHHKVLGINSRLDTIQAAILRIKLRQLESYNVARQQNALRYNEMFTNEGLVGEFELPFQSPHAKHIWNQYGIRIANGERDALRQHLQSVGISTEIYYPIPLHLQECFKELGYSEGSLPHTEAAAKEILHLPIYPELCVEEQVAVVRGIKQFYGSAALKLSA